MSSFEFDNVKSEKEDALWRYNMEKKFKTGFCLTGLLLAWSWFPTVIPGTLQVAGDFSRRFVSTFNEPLYTFVILNFIIAVVYILSSVSSQKQTQKQATTTSTDIYDEYVGSSRRSISTSAAEESISIVDKQIAHVENAMPVSPVKQLETTVELDTVNETNISVSPVEQPTTMTNRTVPTKTKLAVCLTEVKEKEYRRTQSMVSDSITQRPVEFRRSEITAIGGREQTMDEMSSEQFQLIIETFIADRKKNLLQENTAHYTRRKHKCMPILGKSWEIN